MAASTILANLAEHFPAEEVKKNPRGYHYISIDAVQNRLDEVLGPNWDLRVISSELRMLPRSEKTYGQAEKTAFTGVVVVEITAYLGPATKPSAITVTRAGTGADLADDPDKVIKTALANAVKKAANGFGVGRYLWDEEERAAIDAEVRAKHDVPALKRKVMDKALGEGLEFPGDATSHEKATAVALHYGVEVTDLASAATLNEILGRVNA